MTPVIVQLNKPITIWVSFFLTNKQPENSFYGYQQTTFDKLAKTKRK